MFYVSLMSQILLGISPQCGTRESDKCFQEVAAMTADMKKGNSAGWNLPQILFDFAINLSIQGPQNQTRQ